MINQAKFYDLTSQEIYEIFKLRSEVFVVEQKITAENEIDAFDLQAMHFFIKWDGIIVSYMRVILDYDNVRVGRVCTSKNFRGRGFSTMLLREILNKYESIVLSAQLQVIPFYKSLGFVPIGKKYKEADIWHQKMIHIR